MSRCADMPMKRMENEKCNICHVLVKNNDVGANKYSPVFTTFNNVSCVRFYAPTRLRKENQKLK